MDLIPVYGNLAETWDAVNSVAESAEVIEIGANEAFQDLVKSGTINVLQSDNGNTVGFVKNTFANVANSGYAPSLVAGASAIAGNVYTTYNAASAGCATLLTTTAGTAGVCAAFGVGLGVGMYNANPDFWTNLDLKLEQAGETINGKLLCMVQNGKTYLSKKAIDIMKNLLLEWGLYGGTGTSTMTEDEFTAYNINRTSYPWLNDPIKRTYDVSSLKYTWENGEVYTFSSDGAPALVAYNLTHYSYYNVFVMAVSATSFTITLYNGTSTATHSPTKITRNDKDVYILTLPWVVPFSSHAVVSGVPINDHTFNSNPSLLAGPADVAFIVAYGSITVDDGVQKVEINPNATHISADEDLSVTYPEWWDDKIQYVKPDKKIETIGTVPLPSEFPNLLGDYLPVSLPTSDPKVSPAVIPVPDAATNPDAQQNAQSGELPDTTGTEQLPVYTNLPNTIAEILEQIINSAQNITDDRTGDDGGAGLPNLDNPTNGSGSTPIIIPPTSGSAKALFTVYHPTQAAINALGSYLWSADPIAQLRNIFQNPMDAIIGLHLLYTTPTDGEMSSIHLGYLDSGIGSAIVGSQYETIDCGTLELPEYFKTAIDYMPYTQLQLFLPFIGFVDISANDFIKGKIKVEYKIDVYTGACLANVYSIKDSLNSILYTFNGNCAVNLPITGGSYSNLMSTLITTGAGLIGGAVTQGVGSSAFTAMTIRGGANIAVNSQAQISHSGSIGSNVGAMGIKKPYVVITRPITLDAKAYNSMYGFPANATVQLSSCKGYTRVKNCHIDNLSAESEEKKMIDSALKSGVIIN